MKLFERIYSAVFLLVGIFVAVFTAPSFLVVVGIPVAIWSILRGDDDGYGYHVWIGFDKFANAALGGSHEETISSRLGKSVYFDRPPVFFNRNIDRTVSWWLSQVDADHCRKSIDWKVGESYE